MYLFELVFSFSLGRYTGVELLDHMVVLFLIFWRTPCYFLQWQHQFTFPLSVYSTWVPFFPHPHQHLLFLFLLIIAILDKWVVISHYGFDFHFPPDKEYWVSFHVSIGHYLCSLGKNVYSGPLSIFFLGYFVVVVVSFCHAVWHVVSYSPTRNQTCAPCIGTSGLSGQSLGCLF